jgi:hypothetical protein
VVVTGADPLNLTGDLLGGPRVPAIRHRSVHFVGGTPVGLTRESGDPDIAPDADSGEWHVATGTGVADGMIPTPP